MISDSIIIKPQLLVAAQVHGNSEDFPITGDDLFVVTFVSGYIEYGTDLDEAGFMVDSNIIRAERGLGVEVRSIVIAPAWIPLEGGDTISAYASADATMGFVIAGFWASDA